MTWLDLQDARSGSWGKATSIQYNVGVSTGGIFCNGEDADMDERDVELATSENSSDGGSDDDLDNEFEVTFLSDTPQADADAPDSHMVDNLANDDPQELPVAEVTDESKAIPPSDFQHVHSDVPAQSTAVRTQSKRLATDIPDPEY